jgi:hypothetical protein
MSCTWKTISIYYKKLQKKLFQNSFIWKTKFGKKNMLSFFTIIPSVHCIPFAHLNRINFSFCVKLAMSRGWCKYWQIIFYKRCLTHHVCQVFNCLHHTHLSSIQNFILMSKVLQLNLKFFVLKFISFLFNLHAHWINGMYRFNKGFRIHFLFLPPSFDG